MADKEEIKKETLPENVIPPDKSILVDEGKNDLSSITPFVGSYIRTLEGGEGFMFGHESGIVQVPHFTAIKKALDKVENPIGKTFEIIQLGGDKFRISLIN